MKLTKENLRAKFTDDLLIDCGELFELFWRVYCDTEKESREYDVNINNLDKFLEMILACGLKRMWIQPPSVKIFDIKGEENER